MSQLTIQSLQATTHLGMHIDCAFIADHLPFETRFDKRTPHKVAILIETPKCRFTLFRRGGKVVVMGCKSVAQVIEAHRQLVNELQMYSALYNHPMANVAHIPLKINNIVTSGYLGKALNVATMSLYHDNAIYECEQYPGMRYRLCADKPSVCTTLFNSGKLILTGFKFESEIDDIWKHLQSICKPFLID